MKVIKIGTEELEINDLEFIGQIRPSMMKKGEHGFYLGFKGNKTVYVAAGSEGKAAETKARLLGTAKACNHHINILE